MANEGLIVLGLGIVGGVLLVVALLLLRPKPRAPDPDPRPQALDDEGPPVLEHDVLHLRCGECGTTFDVPDTGQRPLTHVCPGCGRNGTLSAHSGQS